MVRRASGNRGKVILSAMPAETSWLVPDDSVYIPAGFEMRVDKNRDRSVQKAMERELSSLTASPAGIRFRATDEVVRFVVFRPEPDYVHWHQFRYC
ncbi:hypothetical protein CBF17_009655 [Pantoea agglomerans]|nr:hypothetical protein CBF17_015205 [Pantoea agglomerans]PHP93939.1 hypothetical protein CBF17_009655 [Pantoea agglomerans]